MSMMQKPSSIELNNPRDKEGELASRYNISGIPALLIFKKGQVVKSFTGLTSGSTLKKALEEAGR